MKKAAKKLSTQFTGIVEYVSVSPHGDPEGVVLNDGTFIKIPPHSLIAKSLIKPQAKVAGQGELLRTEPNRVFHHVQLNVEGELASDDSMGKEEAEELKEKHKADLKKRKDAPSKRISFKGTAIAFGAKPKGEIDRIIFADGTSVHVPKDVELDVDDFAIGDELKIQGESRVYGQLRFIKADSVEIA